MAYNSNIEKLVAEAKEIFLAPKEIFLAPRGVNNGELVNKWYDLGRCLATIRPKCKTHEEFEEHCKTIGISSRTAYYIMGAYRTLYRLRIKPPNSLVSLGQKVLKCH